MALYLISYDAHIDNTAIYRNIDKAVVEEIDYNAKAILQSQRVVKSGKEAKAILRSILAKLDLDDGMCIELIISSIDDTSAMHPPTLIHNAPYVRNLR